MLLWCEARSFTEQQKLPRKNGLITTGKKLSVLIERQNGVETYPEVLWVIMQVLETLCNGPFVLFPLPFAENYLQEVPHPAYDGYIS